MSTPVESFAELGLSEGLLKTLSEIGYETPSPIQAECIPVLLDGRDLIGQAQTGTGKTAAFALPLMEQIDVKLTKPQALVLTPTRELAIQVAEALQSYARNMPGFHVLPIYGGQSYTIQLKQLSRGAHIIVGTPGRVMDHLERKTLNLDHLKTMVLDEADEMLRMGFIDDVEWILERTPAQHQTALFSATMPEQIRRVAQKYLVEPREIKIKSATATVAAIRQVYWQVSGMHKLDALTRILEVEEDFDAAIIFVRTKNATVELADKLSARGYAAAALNGDLNQQMRERVIEQLKSGALDIVVATDVAARGIDVPRVSHVVNYDIPYDTEAYVHRIGRTGRAGRTGNAILFVAPREISMLRTIERATRSPIAPLTLPSRADVTNKRVSDFKDSVVEVLNAEGLDFFANIVSQIAEEQNVGAEEVAAALAMMAQKGKPLQIAGEDPPPRPTLRSTAAGRPVSPTASASRVSRNEANVRVSRIAVATSPVSKTVRVVMTARRARPPPATWCATASTSAATMASRSRTSSAPSPTKPASKAASSAASVSTTNRVPSNCRPACRRKPKTPSSAPASVACRSTCVRTRVGRMPVANARSRRGNSATPDDRHLANTSGHGSNRGFFVPFL